MKKKFIAFMLFSVVMLCLLNTTVSADTGPKPSVKITLEDIGDTKAYVTLLSKYESTGPWCTYERSPEGNNYRCFPEDIFMKFVNYEDTDGFHFLQYGKEYDGEEFAWTYYPPSTFKLLVYFPETDTFSASDIHERYAFDSYFTAKARDDGTLKLSKNYKYPIELGSLIARIALTLVSELLLAYLAFGYRGGRLYLMLAIVNLITQIALNLTVNIQKFYNGQYAYTSYYVLVEALIFITEAAVYYFAIPRLSKKTASKWVAAAYAICANSVSLILGLYFSEVVPQIF